MVYVRSNGSRRRLIAAVEVEGAGRRSRIRFHDAQDPEVERTLAPYTPPRWDSPPAPTYGNIGKNLPESEARTPGGGGDYEQSARFAARAPEVEEEEPLNPDLFGKVLSGNASRKLREINADNKRRYRQSRDAALGKPIPESTEAKADERMLSSDQQRRAERFRDFMPKSMRAGIPADDPMANKTATQLAMINRRNARFYRGK
jgi:hypothetical protein